MDEMRLLVIRHLAQSATPDPRVGTDANEVFFRTDDAHYKYDVRLVREARGIILELLDEVERMQEQLADASMIILDLGIKVGQPQTTHAVYCATVKHVTRLEDEAAQLRWLAGVNGFGDG